MKQGNNLDFVRLVAAGLVLYGHSFVFLGQREPLFLSWLPLGPLGVYIFFTISGYLVSQSWDRDPHLVRFFARRALRIFPGLAVCVVLSILVLGPALTTLPLGDYFRNPHTLGYLQNIALHIVYHLPGVFSENRVPHAVNGSLWSLPVEFLMYIVVSIVGVLRGGRWTALAIAAGSALFTVFWAQVSAEMLVIYNFDLRQAFICGTYFWAGAVFHKFGLARWFTLPAALGALVVLLCLEPWRPLLQIASWVLLPLTVLAFGLASSPALETLTRRGDYSYGIYIYAFPVQQSVEYLWPGVSLLPYLLICSTITLGLAVLSWHGVERPAMRLKPGGGKGRDADGVNTGGRG